jgi:hypothetical protein
VEGVRDGQAEEKPAQVPEKAKQVGEIWARWAWVEPKVWTERMLAALEVGVKGGQWFRMRLRSILRRRQGRRGRALGLDHHRWPNAFFAERGLFSLVTAYAQARQSSRR